MNEPLEGLLTVLKALSDRNRLRIFKLLQYKKMCVCELTEVIGIAQPSVSKHLRILKEAKLVEIEKDGNWINYKLSDKGNEYCIELSRLIKSWLENDVIVVNDYEASKTACRKEILKK